MIAGGGGLELLAWRDNGMAISVRWTQDGQKMTYTRAFSMHELNAIYEVLQPRVLDDITNAVRKRMAAMTALRLYRC